jgi:hypothetical protein
LKQKGIIIIRISPKNTVLIQVSLSVSTLPLHLSTTFSCLKYVGINEELSLDFVIAETEMFAYP